MHIIPIRNNFIYQKHDTKKIEHFRFLSYDRVIFRQSVFVYKFSQIQHKGVNYRNCVYSVQMTLSNYPRIGGVKLLNHIINLVSTCISEIVMGNELILILEFLPNILYLCFATFSIFCSYELHSIVMYNKRVVVLTSLG